MMTTKDAKAVWDFVRRWREQVRLIVVHCKVGTSRSPAVAAAICRGLGDDDSSFFRDYQPNRRIYDFLLKARPADF